jgi:hypothetical protein
VWSADAAGDRSTFDQRPWDGSHFQPIQHSTEMVRHLPYPWQVGDADVTETQVLNDLEGVNAPVAWTLADAQGLQAETLTSF